MRSEWFQIQPLYLSVWCHVLVLNVPCKPLIFIQVKYLRICRTFVLGSFFATYSYICSNLRFLVVEQISLVCFTWVFCLWVPLFTLTGQKCQFPQYLMDMQNTPSAMSGHVQVLLCKKLKLECEDKWCSDSENFINPSRGNFLLDHSTIQWHEGIR